MPKRSFSPAQWLFLLTFAVRLFVLARLAQMPYFVPTGGDMKFYSDWGLRIAHGALTDHQSFYGLPGYAYILAILYKFLNFDKFWVSILAGLIQATADSCTALIIWKLAGEAFGKGNDAGKARAQFISGVAAIAWAFYQPAQVFTAVLMPTSLAVAAFWFGVWILTKKREGAASMWKPWLPIGVLIGFVAMIVATVLFLVPLGWAAIWRDSRLRRWQRLGAMALLFGGVYIGTAPCWIHNYFIAHEPVMLSAHSGLNMYIGNNPDATGYPKMPSEMSASQSGMLADSITMAEKAEGRPLKHYEVSQYWSAKAHAWIAGHFTDWLRLLGRKFANFWNSFQYDDLSLITMYRDAGLLVPGVGFGVVAALAIPGLIFAVIRRRAGWIVTAVLLHMAALMPVFVTERYRLAAVPGLLLLAAFGIWELWASLSRAPRPQWAPAIGYACIGMLAAWWTASTPRDPGLYSLDFYNTGIQALNQEQYGEARHDLETAYRYVPENSEINFALGLLWQQQSDMPRARTFYLQAISINPLHESAWNNLGVLASTSKAWPLAVRCFATALKIKPEDAKASYLQARAFAAMGQWQQAESSIDTALKLDPEQKDFRNFAGLIASRGPLTGQ
jgi:tetratricopeptide (TPR) repeat protein